MYDIKTIAMASDHAGFELKEHIKSYLQEKGYEIKDFGTYSPDSCDYADFAHPAATSVETGEIKMGIGICGSGNGMNITLNKHQAIRSALCWTPEIAALARQHNNANFLVLPARFISEELAEQITDSFLNSTFEGGRHQRRIDKIPLKIVVEGEVFDNRPEA